MASKEPGKSTPAPSESDWIPDPAATIPGVSIEAVWTDEHEPLEKALLGDSGDWKPVIGVADTPDRSQKRTWDAAAGQWTSEDRPQAPADPTAVATTPDTSNESEPVSFGFSECSSDLFTDDFESEAQHAMRAPPEGLIARLRALLGL